MPFLTETVNTLFIHKNYRLRSSPATGRPAVKGQAGKQFGR